MENEVMNYEEVMEPEIETYETDTENSGISAGLAVLIGAGVAAAGIAVVKLGRKAYAKFKAKKELRESEEDFCEEAEEEC